MAVEVQFRRSRTVGRLPIHVSGLIECWSLLCKNASDVVEIFWPSRKNFDCDQIFRAYEGDAYPMDVDVNRSLEKLTLESWARENDVDRNPTRLVDHRPHARTAQEALQVVHSGCKTGGV